MRVETKKLKEGTKQLEAESYELEGEDDGEEEV